MDIKIWLVLGGVGLFLIGMHLMESSIAHLAGRDVKLLLRRNTSNNFRGLLSGTLTTALLQSSSVVSFMTLAFVGSGLIRMVNALAVVLGANIGTTIANWIVATLGFSLNLDIIWYALIGLCGILLVLKQDRKKWEQWLFFFIGLSFLFIALEWMKSGMLATVARFDFSPYTALPAVFFVGIGFLLTFLIQSSNATMAITLSALFAGVIPFHLAASVVIGSELGTSIKLWLGAAGGAAEKKQLALGNILFNALTTVLATILLYPIIYLVQEIIGIGNPLHGLVAFQMVINLGAAILCFPFLHPVARWLERKFENHLNRSAVYIDEALPVMPAFAQEIFKLEVFYFLKRVLCYQAAEFQINLKETGLDDLLSEKEKKNEAHYHHLDDQYTHIKKSHGEIIEYYVKLQKSSTNKTDLGQINQMMKCVHSAMYAAKGLKDINHNKEELLQSGNDSKFSQFGHFSIIVHRHITHLAAILMLDDQLQIKNELTGMLSEIQVAYKELLADIYEKAAGNAMPDKDISTLQNMNRELYSANKSLVYAASDYLLSPEDAEEIHNVVVTVR